MKHAAFTFAALLLTPLAALHAATADTIDTVVRPDTAQTNKFYLGNRAPLLPSPLLKLPIGAIKPQGWLRKQLELEADGFFGHLPELSRFLIKEGNPWLSPDGEGEKFWEEVPYWLKGYGDLAYTLGDEKLIAEAKVWIDGVIGTQRKDGWFGPRANIKSPRVHSTGKPDLWPNMAMLNALQAYHEYSGDERVLRLMTKYFAWQLAVPDEDFLPPLWQKQRAGDNLASVYWLYNRTGDKQLLDLAQKIFSRMDNWTDGVPNWHNVNISQALRNADLLPAIQEHRTRARIRSQLPDRVGRIRPGARRHVRRRRRLSAGICHGTSGHRNLRHRRDDAFL